MRFTGRSETEREEQPTTAEPWLMLYRCVCLRQTGFFFLGSSFLWREEKRVSHRLEHLFTYPQSVAFSICLHRVIVACQIVSLSRKNPHNNTIGVSFSISSSRIICLWRRRRPSGRLTHICHVPPSLPLLCVCVCVCVHLFLIRSDPSRLAVMDYIAPVEKEIKKLRKSEIEKERESWEKLH